MELALLKILSLWIASAAITAVHGDSEQPLYFALMVSSAPTLNTTGVVSAVDQVLEGIRNDTSMLPGYNLQYSVVLDTQCSRTRAKELLNRVLVSKPSTVGVVGGGCSQASEGAVMASNESIPVISFSSTSVTLSDRSVFPSFFRTVPSDKLFPPALATVMRYYGWKQLSILTEEKPQFLKLLPLFNTSLLSAGIFVKDSILFTAESLTTSAATDILDGRSRIFFLNANPRAAISYLCMAFHKGAVYPGYVWITPGWYQQEWWRSDKEYLHSLKCSSFDIQQQLSRSLVLLAYPDNGFQNINSTFNKSSYAMDAVMTLALALNHTLGNESLYNNLSKAIEATMFEGISGDVRFSLDGNRQDLIVLLQQYRVDNAEGSISLTTVARIEEHNFTYINEETNSTLWPDETGIPPTIIVVNFVIAPVYAYVMVMVAIGVTLCAVCLAFNIIFRNRKVVKLTSPNLNYVIVFGAAMLMIGNIFVPSPSQDVALFSIFCGIFSRTFLSLGYDICFVVALVKTIRVAYIFLKASTRKRIVKDWHLLVLATGIIMIEVLFTIPLLVLTQVKGINGLLIRNRNNPPHTNEQGYTIVSDILTCDSSSLYYLIYLGFVIIYKVVIHVIGLVLAFLTRRVSIDPLNDSKYSAAIIYSSTVLLALGVVIIVILASDEIIIYSGVWTTLVFVEVCVFLGLTFIPKAVSLYKDPKGEKIFGKVTDSSRMPHLPGHDTTASNNKITETQLTIDEVEATNGHGAPRKSKANETQVNVDEPNVTVGYQVNEQRL